MMTDRVIFREVSIANLGAPFLLERAQFPCTAGERDLKLTPATGDLAPAIEGHESNLATGRLTLTPSLGEFVASHAQKHATITES
jgi:hypothetical protein